MARFLVRRFALAALTLFLLSIVVFVLAQLLPGDIGRAVLGGFATQESVDQFNRALGVDRPVFVQYADWIWSFLQGDMGKSFQYQVSVSSLLVPSLVNSLKLAAVSFAIIVPLSIVGGVLAGLRRDRLTDRVISISGLSLAVIPEFVTAIVLIVFLGVFLSWLPVTAAAPPGSGFFLELKYLLLPSLALALVYFGYIARMARAGMIEALDADYTRTAYLKGLDTRTVVRKHVLRNALLPTIAVLGTQTGYLIGGLVVIEKIFNYDGIGARIYVAAQNKDFPMIQSGTLIMGLLFLAATLLADILYSILNPRVRYGEVE